MKNTFTLVVVLIWSLLQVPTFAQQTIIPLYSGEIPNSKKTPVDYQEILDTNGLFTKISIPTLTVYTPLKEKTNGTAVIILPSGGYRVVVDEGADFAKAFVDKGITAFVLKYRLPSDEIMQDKSMGPLQDAQMALKIVRQNANTYNINIDKIGLVGVSAGGHLASTEATHLNNIVINNPENINLRPDFLILIYPVISFTHAKVNATIAKLLGQNPSVESLNFFSSENHVSNTTPPTFLLHAADDSRVSFQHSSLFFDALQKAKVKSEFHILQSGGHGFGMEHPTKGDNWFNWCIDWLHENGFGLSSK